MLKNGQYCLLAQFDIFEFLYNFDIFVFSSNAVAMDPGVYRYIL